MFNWFQRSSKSRPAARAPSPTADYRLPARLAPACDPQALARLPACARQLSPDAQRILAGLPPAIALGRSCAQYPQAVEKLLKHWRNPIEFRLILDSMVIDSRGGRQGFPFDIVREFSALREYYDLQVNPVRTNAWASVDAR
jgi:hypothetical protein